MSIIANVKLPFKKRVVDTVDISFTHCRNSPLVENFFITRLVNSFLVCQH